MIGRPLREPRTRLPGAGLSVARTRRPGVAVSAARARLPGAGICDARGMRRRDQRPSSAFTATDLPTRSSTFRMPESSFAMIAVVRGS